MARRLKATFSIVVAGSGLADSFVRVLPKDGSPRIKISYAEIAALAFTGRDMAAGKSWENWVRHYWEKKAAGERRIFRCSRRSWSKSYSCQFSVPQFSGRVLS